MADSYSLCLIELMDRLWFHQIILFSESIVPSVPKILKQPQQLMITKSLLHPSSSTHSLPTPPGMEISPAPSSFPEDESSSSTSLTLLSAKTSISLANDGSEKEDDDDVEEKERPMRAMNSIARRARSYSSSPSAGKRPKKIRHLADSVSVRRLQKSMSSRNLGELELEEVKGFMDLGFVFKQEHLTPRMMTVVPGLQRLGLCSKNKLHDPNLIDLDAGIAGDVKLGQEEKERATVRPYLSEAWLIRRSDSPLLNLRLPRVSSAAAMKKHLKFWARAVASVIKQES